MKSEAIIEKKKEDTLALIFDCLDSDGDNCISIRAVHFNGISTDM